MKNMKQVLIVTISFTTIAAIVYFSIQYRAEQIITKPMLPVAFEHRDHTHTECAECHHNFIDDTGEDRCYACHKFTAEIAPEMEKMFHDFCRGCHEKRQLENKKENKFGPVRSCSACHNSEPTLG